MMYNDDTMRELSYNFQNEDSKLSLPSLDDNTLCGLAQQGSRDAEDVLARRYSRLVRSCARPYFLVGADGEDLLQEGMLGLVKAIRDYSPNAGASFYTFATVCVTRRILSVICSGARDTHLPLNRS